LIRSRAEITVVRSKSNILWFQVDSSEKETVFPYGFEWLKFNSCSRRKAYGERDAQNPDGKKNTGGEALDSLLHPENTGHWNTSRANL
jgi:hypothetical protein